MFSPLELFVAMLATWEIVEIYRHSLLFADRRSKMEARVDKLGDLFQCNFCLAPWVAALCLLILMTEHIPEGNEILDGLRRVTRILRLPLYAFAVARLANLGNDLTHDYCRTPKHDKYLPPWVEPTSNTNLSSADDYGNSEPDDGGTSEPTPTEPVRLAGSSLDLRSTD